MPRALRTPWLFTTAVFLALLAPQLLRQGMFLDGVSYACISNNMARGLGSFVSPYYTASLYPVCHEQPPLVFWLQSLFFRLLGEGWMTERMYAFCAAVATGWGIWLVWREMFRDELIKRNYAWLAVLCWIICPIVFWAYRNNMLECTQSIFCLLAVWAVLKSENLNDRKWLLAAPVFMVLAVLCKGPTGFFPAAAPFVFALAFSRKYLTKAFLSSLFLLTSSLCVLYLLVWSVPGLDKYLAEYLDTRLLPTLAGRREEAANSRLHFLGDLLSQLVFPAVAVASLVFARRVDWKKLRLDPASVFFLLMGTAGTLPLVVSAKQSTHYLLPALPFWAMGLAAVAVQSQRFEKYEKAFRGLGIVLVGAVLVYSGLQFGKFNRDETLISDVEKICAAVGENSVIGAPPTFNQRWTLIAYLGRTGNVSMDYSGKMYPFVIRNKGQEMETPGEEYRKCELELDAFALYQLIRKPGEIQ